MGHLVHAYVVVVTAVAERVVSGHAFKMQKATPLVHALKLVVLTVLAADDYSEFTVISEGGTARVSDRYPFFSLLNMTGTARGISIKGAKYTLDGAEITSGYQYAVSNEVLPGQTAEITIKEGRLLLIMDL